jgi:hypothetical protein
MVLFSICFVRGCSDWGLVSCLVDLGELVFMSWVAMGRRSIHTLRFVLASLDTLSLLLDHLSTKYVKHQEVANERNAANHFWILSEQSLECRFQSATPLL